MLRRKIIESYTSIKKSCLVRFNTHSWQKKVRKVEIKGNSLTLIKSIHNKHTGTFTLNGERLRVFPQDHEHVLSLLFFNTGWRAVARGGKRCTDQKGSHQLSCLQMTWLPRYKFPRILQKNSKTDKWVHLSA